MHRHIAICLCIPVFRKRCLGDFVVVKDKMPIAYIFPSQISVPFECLQLRPTSPSEFSIQEKRKDTYGHIQLHRYRDRDTDTDM